MKKFALLALVCALTLSATAAFADGIITLTYESGGPQTDTATIPDSATGIAIYVPSLSANSVTSLTATGALGEPSWAYIGMILGTYMKDNATVSIKTTAPIPTNVANGTGSFSGINWNLAQSTFSSLLGRGISLNFTLGNNSAGTTTDTLAAVFSTNVPINNLTLESGAKLKVPQNWTIKGTITVAKDATLDLSGFSLNSPINWTSAPKLAEGSTIVVANGVTAQNAAEVLKAIYGNNVPSGVTVKDQSGKELYKTGGSGGSSGCDTGAAFMLFLPALLALAPWKKR